MNFKLSTFNKFPPTVPSSLAPGGGPVLKGVFSGVFKSDVMTNVNDPMLSVTFDFLYDTILKDSGHTVPYLAGYSKSRDKIYFDKHFPQFMGYKGKKFDVYRYVCGHERVEDSVLASVSQILYQYAHQIALRVEMACVIAEMGSWDPYNAFCSQYIKRSGDERLEDVPDDLDIKPYVDSVDTPILERMEKDSQK